MLPKTISKALPRVNGGIFTARFHPNGRNLFVAGADRKIRLYNPFTPLLIHTFSRHAYQVLSLAVSPSENNFASSGGDRAIFLWDLTATTLLHKFEGAHGHTQRVNDVTFAGEHLLVSGSYDATVAIWDCRSRSNRPIQTIGDATDSVSSVLALRSTQIVTSSVDGYLRIYDVRAGKLSSDNLFAPVSSIRLTRDKNCLLAACLDNSMLLLNTSDGEILSKYHGHVNHSYNLDCTVSHDDAYVMCGSEDGAFYYWDIVSGSLPLHANLPPGRASVVSALDAHPSKSICVSATHDGDVFLWE